MRDSWALDKHLFSCEEKTRCKLSRNASDARPAVSWRENLVLHLHEQTGFRSGFFSLRDMQVHLVTVKVRVVRWAYGWVESEGFVWKNPYSVSHYRHSVKAGLPVEEHNVAVSEMSLH